MTTPRWMLLVAAAGMTVAAGGLTLFAPALVGTIEMLLWRVIELPDGTTGYDFSAAAGHFPNLPTATTLGIAYAGFLIIAGFTIAAAGRYQTVNLPGRLLITGAGAGLFLGGGLISYGCWGAMQGFNAIAQGAAMPHPEMVNAVVTESGAMLRTGAMLLLLAGAAIAVAAWLGFGPAVPKDAARTFILASGVALICLVVCFGFFGCGFLAGGAARGFSAGDGTPKPSDLADAIQMATLSASGAGGWLLLVGIPFALLGYALPSRVRP